LGGLNPPPQLLEFKHLSGNDGPNLKDRRKAMIEHIHFFNSRITESPRANVGTAPDITFQIRSLRISN